MIFRYRAVCIFRPDSLRVCGESPFSNNPPRVEEPSRRGAGTGAGEAGINAAPALFDTVVITRELARRRRHAPDLRVESAALQAIIGQLARGNSRTLLDVLMHAALQSCAHAGSAGVSLLESLPTGEEVCRSVALVGRLASYVGGTTPRHFSPCGMTLDRGSAQLFSRPARIFPYFAAARPEIVEGLVVPFRADGVALGTIWITAHDDTVAFDAEHVRVMERLADLTAVAFRAKRSEEERMKLAAIVEELADGVAVFDSDGRCLYANDAASRMWGVPPAAIAGKRYLDLYPEADSLAFAAAFRRVVASRRSERVQTFLGSLDRWLESDITSRADGTIVVGFREITDQKHAELALRESEAHARSRERRYRSLVQASAQIVWIAKADGRSGLETQTWREFTGLSYETSLGDSWLSAIHPEDRERTRRAWIDAVARRVPYEIEYRLLRADGSFAHTLVRAAPVVDDDGTVVEWIGTITDITEKKAAEEVVRRERERFRTALAEASVGMAITSPEGRFIEVNASYCRITGYAADELVGLEFSAVTHPDDRERNASMIRRAVGGEIPGFVLEKRCLRKSGDVVWVHDCVSIVRDENGAPHSLIAITEDVTANKLADAERRRLFENAEIARAEAEAANRSKDEFLATLSHELKTPVGIMNVWGEVLRRAADEGLRRRAFQAIDEAVRAQGRLVDDLLDASRISAGKVALKLRPTELHPIIETTIEAARPAAAARKVRLRYVCRRGGALVMGDADRLLQVVANIVSNAVKFTPDGGDVKLTLTCPDAQTAQITVRDSGEGIAPELLPHVFEAFRQGDATSTRAHGGLGLGLAIVLQMVKMQNGTVTVASAGKGKGTTVTVKLALVRRRKKTSPVVVAPEPRRAFYLSPGLRVLVVDDEKAVREGLATLLEREGADVVTVASAGEALREILRQQPDVLVSDIGMPDMDGYDLIRTVRQLGNERGARISAIALSAYETEDAAARALAAGFQRHLPKSAPFVALVEAIAELRSSAPSV